jgi:hypothetical protein
VEDMPTARYMELLDKADKREVTPAEMQELRKIGDEWHNEKIAKFRRENPGWKNLRAMSISRRPPGVSRSLHWLDELKKFYGAYGADESHPRVARVFGLIQKAESGAITAQETEEFRKEIDLLQDDLVTIWNAAHPNTLQLQREKPISKFKEAYWRYLISPGPDKPPVPHEPTEEGSECKRCGQKKIYWERQPSCSLVKPPPPSPEARDAFRRRIEDELQQARKFVERSVSKRQRELFAKGVRELEERLNKLNDFES